MAEGRKRNTAKRARREARRGKRRTSTANQGTDRETPLLDEVRHALDGGQPLDLLGLVSMLIVATSPRPAGPVQPDAERLAGLDELVAAFLEVSVPETTALLTGLGELIGDDDTLRDRCRGGVEARNDRLPRWLVDLAQTSVHRAVRMTHVHGGGDELLLGVRLADGQEMTCAIYFDPLAMSAVGDAFFVPETIDTVLGVARAGNTDTDTDFLDVELTDARTELQHALDNPLSMLAVEESDTWPSCRALVQWLARLVPVGD
jgi:hypothetical protein